MTLDAEGDALALARKLLADSVDRPDIARTMAADVSFLEGGLDSGELIRLVQHCEELLDTELDDGQLGLVTSLHELAALLRAHGAGRPDVA